MRLQDTAFNMRQTRRHRVLTVLIALFGMLFMQLAVASYACPGLQVGIEQTAAPDDGQAMPDCAATGTPKPALCHAHCQDGSSSLDKAELKTFTPAAVLFAPVLIAFDPVLPSPQPRHAAFSLLQRITAPPISIRHCCWRI